LESSDDGSDDEDEADVEDVAVVVCDDSIVRRHRAIERQLLVIGNQKLRPAVSRDFYPSSGQAQQPPVERRLPEPADYDFTGSAPQWERMSSGRRASAAAEMSAIMKKATCLPLDEQTTKVVALRGKFHIPAVDADFCYCGGFLSEVDAMGDTGSTSYNFMKFKNYLSLRALGHTHYRNLPPAERPRVLIADNTWRTYSIEVYTQVCFKKEDHDWLNADYVFGENNVAGDHWIKWYTDPDGIDVTVIGCPTLFHTDMINFFEVYSSDLKPRQINPSAFRMTAGFGVGVESLAAHDERESTIVGLMRLSAAATDLDEPSYRKVESYVAKDEWSLVSVLRAPGPLVKPVSASHSVTFSDVSEAVDVVTSDESLSRGFGLESVLTNVDDGPADGRDD
jgi:hypothetical protein